MPVPGATFPGAAFRDEPYNKHLCLGSRPTGLPLHFTDEFYKLTSFGEVIMQSSCILTVNFFPLLNFSTDTNNYPFPLRYFVVLNDVNIYFALTCVQVFRILSQSIFCFKIRLEVCYLADVRFPTYTDLYSTYYSTLCIIS